MTQLGADLVTRTEHWIAERSRAVEGSHDFQHVRRVVQLAQHIAQHERVQKNPADDLVLSLAAWLHDVADAKFHAGDEAIGPRLSREWLETQAAEFPACIRQNQIGSVEFIVAHLSFRHHLERRESDLGYERFENEITQRGISLEFGAVHDADKLDAMGAIGIARCFAYGGSKGRALYDPEDRVDEPLNKESYTKSSSASLSHFYEKLFRLRELMRTDAGRQLATERDRYMHGFVDRFLKEWYIETPYQ